MFRWIVKLIRDEFGIDEKILVRTATLETDMGLSIEQVEQVLEYIAESFQVTFPENTLDEIVKLEELCMLASWMKGYYKRPEFISDGFEARVIAARLGSEGIVTRLRGGIDTPYPMGDVEVLVAEEDLEVARELLLADEVESAFAPRVAPRRRRRLHPVVALAVAAALVAADVAVIALRR